MFQQLWNDDGGACYTCELLLCCACLCLPLITGLTSLRDGLITELADCGDALAWIDQSYVYHGVKAHSSATANHIHFDNRDFCDDGQVTTNSRCLVICNGELAVAPAGGESGS